MTTTDSPNYVRVVPLPGGSANGNGTASGTDDEGSHAQPRAQAREGRSVAPVLAAVRRARAQRRVAIPDDVQASDRADLFHRAPLSLAELWERISGDVAEQWNDEDGNRLAAALLAIFGALFALPVTAFVYALGFCAQEWHRAAWLVVGAAVLVVPFITL